MTRLAFYLRYSCDKQSPTSCEDQLRRCYDVARRYGLPTDNAQVFADDALSASKDEPKRTEFQRLLAAWDAHQFDVVVVDEWSRLTREGVEHAKMVKRLEDNRRIRLITGNGLDTDLPNWQLVAGLFGMVGQQSTRDTQYRVTRGMVGQLERGYMVAPLVFGYDLQPEYDPTGRRVGTRWVVNEHQAAIVREIYARREQGQSMRQIARWLNDTQVATSRSGRKNSGGFWRQARVRGLLANPIYRGEFHWHRSANYQGMAKKKGLEEDITAYPRPHLRLVSDETWQRCNQASVSRSGYGGGKHALAGLVTCGCCGGTLVLSSQERCRSLYCASCRDAKGCAGQSQRLTATVAAAGMQVLLTEALKAFITPDFIETFRQSLREKLTGDHARELEACTADIARLERVQKRMLQLLSLAENDDPLLMQQYTETREQVRALMKRRDDLQAGVKQLDHQSIQAQLDTDPVQLLDGLFDAELSPERVRAVLVRLFPEVVFEGKSGRYAAYFRICFAPGVALALSSQTEVVDTGSVEQCFVLRYTPDNRSGREQRWSVERGQPTLRTSVASDRLGPTEANREVGAYA